MALHTARWVWTGTALLRDHAVRTDGAGRVVAVEAAADAAPGLLLPGLVNAHVHLELSGLRGAVPGGAGSTAWVRALSQAQQARGAADPEAAASPIAAAARAAAEARASGTAFLIDLSNAGGTDAAFGPTGLRGVVLRELLGVTPSRWQGALQPPADTAAVRFGVTAHSPISCSPALLRAVLAERPRGRPAPTIHCDEDPADRLLLSERRGSWADFHAHLARVLPAHAWETGLPRAPSGVQALDALGLLGPHLGLVHLVAADAADLDAVARSGATAILCPRSNRHISGRLPDVAGMVSRGIPLALGTDSLASTPDLDLLAEAAALAEAFPALPGQRWLEALTAGGAALLADPDAGHLRPGARPGILRVALPETDDPAARLVDGTPWPRTWLS